MSALSYVVPGQATRWLDVSVAAVRPVCRDVVAIELDYAVPLPPHDAGSHIKVELAIDGRRGVRSYSVVEHRQSGRLVVAVRRLDNGQGGSKAMHGLRAGDVLRATLPGNHFLLLPGAPSYLLIAGGIGITPMIGMARTLRRLRAPFQLLYLGRSRASMPFVDDLAAEFGADLRVHVDEDSGPIDFGPSLAALPPAAEAYLCGPGPMLAAVRELWRGLGRPSELLRFETFGSASEKAWAPFRVSVPQYDVAFEVPSDRSFLEMLEEAGCEPLYFCQRGECGLCAVDVLQADGDLDHRDVFFSETQRREGRQICVCVSRVTGSITIAMP